MSIATVDVCVGATVVTGGMATELMLTRDRTADRAWWFVDEEKRGATEKKYDCVNALELGIPHNATAEAAAAAVVFIVGGEKIREGAGGKVRCARTAGADLGIKMQREKIAWLVDGGWDAVGPFPCSG